MSLKINGRSIQSLPLRFRGSVGFEYAETNKASQRNIYASEGITDDASGNPAGHLYPSAWIWPQKSGSMSAFKSVTGESDVSANLALGVNIDSSLSGSSTTTATGFVTANMSASISGSSTVSGNVVAFVNGSFSLLCSSTVSGDIEALGGASANINNNVGTVYGIPYAQGIITCTISPFTELSPQNLANAVWEASKNDYTTPDTMGVELKKKLGKIDYLSLK